MILVAINLLRVSGAFFSTLLPLPGPSTKTSGRTRLQLGADSGCPRDWEDRRGATPFSSSWACGQLEGVDGGHGWLVVRSSFRC